MTVVAPLSLWITLTKSILLGGDTCGNIRTIVAQGYIMDASLTSYNK